MLNISYSILGYILKKSTAASNRLRTRMLAAVPLDKKDAISQSQISRCVFDLCEKKNHFNTCSYIIANPAHSFVY